MGAPSALYLENLEFPVYDLYKELSFSSHLLQNWAPGADRALLEHITLTLEKRCPDRSLYVSGILPTYPTPPLSQY